MRAAGTRADGATVFAYPVHDPERYGVVEFNEKGKAISLEEKPQHPKSRYAVNRPVFLRSTRTRHRRGPEAFGARELEITDVNRAYLELGALDVKVMGRVMRGSTRAPMNL